jgi:hypothetical protein
MDSPPVLKLLRMVEGTIAVARMSKKANVEVRF